MITIFTVLSCSEKKKGTNKKDEIEVENENKTDTEIKISNLETSDTLNSIGYSDLDNQTTYTKELDLFWIRIMEGKLNKKVGFISLSDIYPLSENQDSLAIPNIENLDNNTIQYFKLNSTYRKRLLSKTNISETDSVFIYDYFKDVLLSFSVNKLNAVACLNVYMDIKDCPCNQIDYMIGFEVANNSLNRLGEYFSDALVFIGKENPFTRGQMKPIIWKKIKTEKFPLEKSQLTEVQKKCKNQNAIKGQAYLSETDKYHIFIQDYILSNTNMVLEDRHLIVFDKKLESIVHETLFSSSEGSSISLIGDQWTGSLFKNKPDVIFGFEDVSFGCPTIDFINSKDNIYVQINCDNRH
jgi:hypothetical protein